MKWPESSNKIRNLLFRFLTRGKGYAVYLGERRFRLEESLRRYSIPEDDSLYQCLKANLKSGDVFIDVGANIGLYSLISADLVGGNGKVFSFEPSPINASLFRQNVCLNHLDRTISIQEVALTDTADGETVAFYLPKRGSVSGESSLVEKGNDLDVVRVPRGTMDSFCFEHNLIPDLIKIDTEGAELPIVKGSLDTIRQHRPKLIVEYHGGKCVDFGYEVKDLWQMIEGLGYEQSYIMRKSEGYFMTFCSHTDKE